MSITIDDNKIDDEKIDRALRPKCFDDYIGQQSLKDKLKIAIKAAKARNEPLCSCLIHGPSGRGKSTIANIIASEYGSDCKTVMAPAIKTTADLLDILTKNKPNSFLFIDEIHALPLKLEESIYSAIEDFKVSIRVANKEIVHIKIKPFCLLAATTELGRISEPLRNRFGIIHPLEDYTNDEMSLIIEASIAKLKLKIDNKSIYYEIAKRSRGTPRLANRLIYRLRDYAQILNNNIINQNVLETVMSLEGIDSNGLTNADIKYLKSLYKNFNAGPAGLVSIASSINEDQAIVENTIEPLLLKNGLIIKTKSGRMLTKEGLEYVLN
jgi:Holliday junction DNA helicase RuvB